MWQLCERCEQIHNDAMYMYNEDGRYIGYRYREV